MTEAEQSYTNGTINEEDEENKVRPADIEQDMREMERRKRVEAIMNSRLFREELERIVDGQIREGPPGLLQQLSDIMGVPAARIGNVFKGANCVVPINDIRGVEAMGYEKGEKILRCKLASTFRLLDLYGWTKGLGSQITARLNADQELFLVNPYGLLYNEVTASSLNKVDMQGSVTEQGTTNFGVDTSHFLLHSAVHASRPDIRCIIYVGFSSVVAVSALKCGLLPLTRDAVVLGEIAVHNYTGGIYEPEEKEKLIRSLGPNSKILLLTNHGALCCGETIEEAFFATYHIIQACEAQLKLLPLGLDNLILIPEETRKAIYDESRKPPEGSTVTTQDNKERPHQAPKWRVGGADFEALMRMLDNAGYRTGYIYRNPLIKGDLPKPKNDVELPPAVSSLGYLLEEEEFYKQGIWKKSDLRKGGERNKWLNSPNVYQKVEILETGTPDPKKITKWVADGSPNHSTAVKIEHALQFVPTNTNPKEFKKLQQQIKDNRRADKISAGPQSHILEGVSWDEAARMKDATVSETGDHVVLMGAASKGIIQRGYQHNATVYKAPYAKNPFDSVTDDELNEYKKTVERKRHGDYTDTDFSESEALSSLQISGQVKSPQANFSETDGEHHVIKIETKHAPKPSQPEVVLSDATADFINREKAASGKKGKVYRSTKTINHKLSTQSVIRHNNSNRSHETYTIENLMLGNELSPYRSNAFLGFHKPDYTAPNHFHLPKGLNKFVPIRRSKSLTEVFSNEKYSKLLDNSPIVLPYAGRMAPPAKRLQRKLFYEAAEQDENNPFKTYNNTDIQMELSSIHSDLLKAVDEKIDQITQPASETFYNRISCLDYNSESPLNKEENNNNNPIANLNTDVQKHKGRKTFEGLNAFEQAIILELERGNLDKSEGTIFHKIEHEIKSKPQSQIHYEKLGSIGDTAKNSNNKKFILQSSTPVLSKIPVFRPSTVPKVKLHNIQRTKTRNLVNSSRSTKSKFIQEKKPSVWSKSSNTNPSAIFGLNPFSKESKGAFQLKNKNNASCLWVPLDKNPITSGSKGTKSKESCSTSNITDFVDHQTSSINDLGNYQKRMKEDIAEILSIHENIETNVHSKPKTFKK